MKIVRLHTADVVATAKSGRVLVALQIRHAQKIENWISEKQAGQLGKCFGKTPKGFSTGKIAVYAVMDGDRFVWCGVHTPAKSDLPFLSEKFGAALPDDDPYADEVNRVAIPNAVEALDDLRD